MVSVCAWCERFLGIKEPKSDSTITHGICRTCFARQTWTETPVLVVSRERQHLVPVLEEMMRGIPEIRLVVDRRCQDRRQQQSTEITADRRQRAVRRGEEMLLS